MPFHDGDRPAHERLHRWVARCAGHEPLPVHCPADGVLRSWGFCVRPGLAYVTCNQLWSGLVRRLPLGTTFLWLEPDCVPTRFWALDELDRGFRSALERNPDLSVWGHDKRDQWPEQLKFLSGVSVYRVTEALRSVAASISHHKPHDMEIGRELLGTPYLVHTPLIRCVWGYKEEGYLGCYEKEGARVLERHPEAALIHGDRDGEIWRSRWGEGEAA